MTILSILASYPPFHHVQVVVLLRHHFLALLHVRTQRILEVPVRTSQSLAHERTPRHILFLAASVVEMGAGVITGWTRHLQFLLLSLQNVRGPFLVSLLLELGHDSVLLDVFTAVMFFAKNYGNVCPDSMTTEMPSM